jgi:hypothetical protein
MRVTLERLSLIEGKSAQQEGIFLSSITKTTPIPLGMFFKGLVDFDGTVTAWGVENSLGDPHHDDVWPYNKIKFRWYWRPLASALDIVSDHSLNYIFDPDILKIFKFIKEARRGTKVNFHDFYDTDTGRYIPPQRMSIQDWMNKARESKEGGVKTVRKKEYGVVEALVGEWDRVIGPAIFKGKLQVDDSDPDRPWAYLSVEKGIPKAAYEALSLSGVPCEPHFDDPHMTAIKNDEAKGLIKRFGKGKWKDAVLTGPTEFIFTITSSVDLDPDGWDAMDRVWFLQCESPELERKRVLLGLTPLPTGEDGDEQAFHITYAVRPAVQQNESMKFVVRTLLR